MKLPNCLIVALALSLSCKQINPVFLDLSHTLAEAYNPSVLSLQLLAVKLKREKGKWAASQSDYVNALGDSASAVLADFELVRFNVSNDTLTINYVLKEPIRKVGPAIDFVALGASEAASEFKIDSSLKQLKNHHSFRVNEGKLIFFRDDEHAISIIHEYHGGAAKHKITNAEH